MAAQLSRLGEATPGPSAGAEPDSDEHGEDSGEGGTRTPLPTAQATTNPPTMTPAVSAPAPRATGLHDEDHEPAAADTFFLYLDDTGAVIGNPGLVRLAGLPDPAGVERARSGDDLRTVEADGTRIRLLTVAIPADEETAANGARFLQAGFVLTLHDEQSANLLTAVLLVGLVSLAGAAVLTFFLTARALVPIRAAFERERRFVAAASHELRTPTAIIRSTAEVLEREGMVEPDGRPFVADIMAESDRLAGLVADLSALATAQAGPAASLQPVDLTALAADVVHRAQPMAGAAGVVLEVAPNGMPVRVVADVDRLVQVALILIDNAVQHTPSGRRVMVATAATPHNGELSVADEGPGVPAADRERIFEPFARLGAGRAGPGAAGPGGRGATSPVGADGGSGLGLAIARTIVGSPRRLDPGRGPSRRRIGVHDLAAPSLSPAAAGHALRVSRIVPARDRESDRRPFDRRPFDRFARARGPPSPDRPVRSSTKGRDLEAERGPGLGCFQFQLVLLVVLIVLTPISVYAGMPDAVSAGLLFATILLLLFTGQTMIFLLRLVAAERRGRRRPLSASATPTVGELEDATTSTGANPPAESTSGEPPSP